MVQGELHEPHVPESTRHSAADGEKLIACADVLGADGSANWVICACPGSNVPNVSLPQPVFPAGSVAQTCSVFRASTIVPTGWTGEVHGAGVLLLTLHVRVTDASETETVQVGELLSCGEQVTPTVGTMLSKKKVRLALELFPAWSVQVTVTTFAP
jgi:hypothetical protein